MIGDLDNNYLKIADHYKEKFAKYGDTPQGYDWENYNDMQTRYKTMFELVSLDKNKNYFKGDSILDFGCGAGGFYHYLDSFTNGLKYVGIDINEQAIITAREKYPEGSFGLLDIHSSEGEEAFNNPKICNESYDYIVCNGTFTVKGKLTHDQMSEFMCSTLEKLWKKTNKGIAFNLMSKNVDWERDDLYHVSMDQIVQWLTDNLSRNIVVRSDYKLYEYTIYVYR